MLESINLKGWQRHKTLTIEFDPKLTTITGASEAGKSAIVRALKWAMLNQWNGEADINRASTVARITLRIDGHEIIRKRSSSNLYRLDDAKFKALGKAGVPEAIAHLVNVSELNFQDQFEPHFWLSQSAGQVSKELNSIIDLEIIDRAIATANSAVRHQKTVVEVSRQRLKKAKEEKKALAWVTEAADKLKDLQKRERAIFGRRNEITLLSRFCQWIPKTIEKKERLESLFERSQKIQAIHERLSNTESLELLIGRIKKQEALKTLPIPKYRSETHGKAERLEQLIERITETQWLRNQTCPTCERKL